MAKHPCVIACVEYEDDEQPLWTILCLKTGQTSIEYDVKPELIEEHDVGLLDADCDGQHVWDGLTA